MAARKTSRKSPGIFACNDDIKVVLHSDDMMTVIQTCLNRARMTVCVT